MIGQKRENKTKVHIRHPFKFVSVSQLPFLPSSVSSTNTHMDKAGDSSAGWPGTWEPSPAHSDRAARVVGAWSRTMAVRIVWPV